METLWVLGINCGIQMPGTIAILQTVLSIQSADHKLVVLILGGREQLLIWRLFYSKAAVITAPEF